MQFLKKIIFLEFREIDVNHIYLFHLFLLSLNEIFITQFGDVTLHLRKTE